MSIHRLYSLDAFCDNCHRSFGEADDEPATGVGMGHWFTDMRDARRDMKTYGWIAKRVYRMTKDYCPKCAAILRGGEEKRG